MKIREKIADSMGPAIIWLLVKGCFAYFAYFAYLAIRNQTHDHLLQIIAFGWVISLFMEK